MPDRDESVDERKVSPSLIAGVLIALAAIDFVVQNRASVTVHFLFLSFESKVWVALVVTAVLSIVAAEFFGVHLRRRKKKD